MKDLSNLAESSMWATSQAGGNRPTSNEHAMTAPGSEPADLPPAGTIQRPPSVDMGKEIPVGSDGKSQPTEYSPGPAVWKTTT